MLSGCFHISELFIFFRDIFKNPETGYVDLQTHICLILLGPITWLFIVLMYAICIPVSMFVQPAKDWSE